MNRQTTRVKEDDLHINMSSTEGGKLNLVVCGSDRTLSSSISDRIRRSGIKLHGCQISLVELPALIQLSEEEMRCHTLHCVSLCDPGVHVFLLIIPDSLLTNEDKAGIENIQKIFSSRINKHIMILIIQNSEHQTAELTEETQSVIENFGGRQHFFGPKTQVSTLMENIEKMLEENRGEVFSTDTLLEAQMNKTLQSEEMNKKINSLDLNIWFQSSGSTENEDDLRIVMLGKTGVGKSAAGNTILGRNAFTAETSQESITKESRREASEINGRHITVIDTPGLFDTELTNDETQKEISNCISMILPGPHVFIIVLSLGQRYTQEEVKSVNIIQEMFGENCVKYIIVLFTRGDDLKNKTIEETLGKPESPLMKLIEACGNRYHVFNNNQTEDRTQVSDLLEKIDNMVKVNGGSFYSCKMFRQMEREKQEKQMKFLMDRFREREEIINKLEEEKEKMKMMMEEERKNHDKERKRREEELKNEIREQEKHQQEIREEMRRDREMFKNEKEEMRQEKEKIKGERDQLKITYDTEIAKLMKTIENERQNHDKDREKREKDYTEREEQYKTQIKEKEEKEREIYEEMKREREEWEKQKLEEMIRREEEDQKIREKEVSVCDEFNQRLKKEREDLQSIHEAKENNMTMLMERMNKEKEELMRKHEEEKERIKMMMEEERQNYDKERKRREEEFGEREERYKGEIKDKVEQEREMRENTKREQEMLKNAMEELRQEKEYVKKEKENLKTEYYTETQRLMNRIENERQNYETEIKKREVECNEREHQYLDNLETRLKEETNIREDQQKTFEEKLKLLKEQHEEELKRRRVEWREEYEREKAERATICSITDDPLQVTAYRKLENEYSKWSWSLCRAMMETENKLHNKIENKAIDEVEETDFHRELKKTSEEVEKSISEFFEKDTDADILIQWKTSFEIKINELQENIVIETNKKFNETLQQQDLKKKTDAQRTHHENTLYEKSKELALKLKDKINDETLKKEFDLFWEQSVKRIIKETPAIKDIDVMGDAKEILGEIYEGHLPEKYLKVSRDIFSLPNYSDYVLNKNISRLTGSVKDSFRSTKDKPVYILSREDEAQIRTLVSDVVQQTDKMIQSFNISKMGYNISYIQELIDYIKKRVDEHEERPTKYMFKKKIFMHLVISICKRSKKMIADQHRMFREANDPVIYAKKKRQENYSIFQKHLHGAASAAIFGKIICEKLKEPVEQSVYKKTARDLTDEMRSNCESLKGNRSNLEKQILKTLAKEEDFDKYMNYIYNPRDHLKSFIRDEVSRYIAHTFSVSVLPKMKENIEVLKQKIIKAAHESTEHVQENRGDVGLWLKSFTQQLSDVLVFSVKDLSGVKHDDVDDFKLLEDVIGKELFCITFDISIRFNTETFPVKLDYKFRPDEILIDHFSQCCWVQCPFCKATCTNTIENHDEDHSAAFHRMTGIYGTYYRLTQNLCADICTNLVASDQYFNTLDGTFKYRKYRKAGERFANWSISSDLSELPYWKWFVCRFQKDLEKYYSKTFDGCGKIPDEWRKYSKLDAIESADQCI